MFAINQGITRDLCDGLTRRELLRVGGSSVMGLGLANRIESHQFAAVLSHAVAKPTK